MFGKSGVYAGRFSLKAHFFRQPFKGAESGQDVGGLLHRYCPDFHAQFRAVGTNYNQVVKELRLHFSREKAMALLYKLEQQTVELVKLEPSRLVGTFKGNGGKMVAKIRCRKFVVQRACLQRGENQQGGWGGFSPMHLQ